jgi:hypothetical protein
MIAVVSTLAPHKVDGQEGRWLEHAEAMIEAGPDRLEWFLAVEIDARGLAPFARLLDRLAQLDGRYWTYHLDQDPDGGDQFEVRSGERHIRVCMGRNLGIEYALRRGASHVLFLDVDISVPADTLPRLLALQHPIVGGHVPSYCLSGPAAEGYPSAWDVQQHWNTAGFLLCEREVIRRVRWGHDPDEGGLSDDPTFARDVARMLGAPTLVRHDVIGDHEPLVPLEQRGTDRLLRKLPVARR